MTLTDDVMRHFCAAYYGFVSFGVVVDIVAVGLCLLFAVIWLFNGCLFVVAVVVVVIVVVRAVYVIAAAVVVVSGSSAC